MILAAMFFFPYRNKINHPTEHLPPKNDFNAKSILLYLIRKKLQK